MTIFYFNRKSHKWNSLCYLDNTACHNKQELYSYNYSSLIIIAQLLTTYLL